ncbi:tRNA pseudouridine(55) synthase TruB [Deltaproteobacteria bacterium Smac51]|nr:tRNA pseudouridine(55) synthase TruB [Deltaproteobacteria bacterium Smac51]
MSAAKAPPRHHGLLLIDKPAGLTSHDVVGRVRRLAGQKRVGHTGTLDPMATGLMAVLLGAATRLEPYLTKMDKTYSGRVQLGLTTDSDDITGAEISRVSGPWPEAAAAELALKGKVGEADQVPPAYSAIKVDGCRAYKAARAGNPLKLAARRVTAYRLEMTGYQAPFLDFIAEVSSGYYIRSLARDLGAELGLGGALASLRRESVGPWAVSRAVTLEELAEWGDDDWSRGLMPPAEALPHLPGLTLEGDGVRFFTQGRPVPLGDYENNVDNRPIKVLNAEGLLIGLGEIINTFPERNESGPLPGRNPGQVESAASDQSSADHAHAPHGPYLRPMRVLSTGAE